MAGDWRARFTAPRPGFPQWAAARPDLLAFLDDESGSPQVWVLDLTTGRRRRLTDERLGVEWFLPLPDGSGVAWWRDATGDGTGAWLATGADGGSTRPLLADPPPGWPEGLALAGGTVAAAFSDDDGYRVHVAGAPGSAPREVFFSAAPAGIGRAWEQGPGGLSADAALLCVRHADDGGDVLHAGLRVIETGTGCTVADLRDPGLSLHVGPWSPLPGDARLAVVHERDGIERPAVWEPLTGARTDCPLDLPGPVDVAGWWPDASALLLLHELDGRRTLHRLDLATGRADLIHDPQGWVQAAAVRPDGEVWLLDESGTRPPRVRTTDGRDVLAPHDGEPTPPSGPQPPSGGEPDPGPPGRPHRSLHAPGEAGPVHVLVTLPDGPPPHPAVVLVHGGPEWADHDELDPWVAALADKGFAVVRPRYRGSTGSTVAWRTALHGGRIGFPEVADVGAALDHVVALGLVDAGRVAVEGWSWGGYVALLAAGLAPERWAAVIAGVPVADTVMCHEDCSPAQQAYDVAIMGGPPSALPELYAERSPLTYVDAVRAPVLLIAGEHDSACPIRQVRAYAGALAARGADVELRVEDAGHHALDAAVRIEQAELRLAFLRHHLPASGVPQVE